MSGPCAGGSSSPVPPPSLGSWPPPSLGASMPRSGGGVETVSRAGAPHAARELSMRALVAAALRRRRGMREGHPCGTDHAHGGGGVHAEASRSPRLWTTAKRWERCALCSVRLATQVACPGGSSRALRRVRRSVAQDLHEDLQVMGGFWALREAPQLRR